MPAETHSHGGPLEPLEVEALVCDRLAEVLGLEAVEAEARLRDDLGVDGYSLLDLAAALEEDLGERTVGFSLDDEDLAELVTVGDLVECVVGRLGLDGSRRR